MSETAVLCVHSTRKVCRIRYWQAGNREVTIEFLQYKSKISPNINIDDAGIPGDRNKSSHMKKRNFSDDDNSKATKFCKLSTLESQGNRRGCDTKLFPIGEGQEQGGDLLMDLLDPLTYMSAVEPPTPEGLTGTLTDSCNVGSSSR
eukprot:CAMPEP_0185263574 /NCGR_PEP_ID=MMETSP1359-20130426/15309_1 /TAXON_ID=552665 /ORGANISM="Bigelowiella longifila, Strain CCMP242" /LENGTH=145 /DNA_ID=CAMNT_0027851197 /DNA_START=432 /DNA_END=869 /DNA_ORIENTATION=+